MLITYLQKQQRQMIEFFSTGEEPEEFDGSGWPEKPIENWCQEETINWLMAAASYIGQTYASISQCLAVPGKQLVTFTKHDFVNYDPIYGEKLYNLLHSRSSMNLRKSKNGHSENYEFYRNNNSSINNNNRICNLRQGEFVVDRTQKNFQSRCPEDELPAISSNSVSGWYLIGLFYSPFHSRLFDKIE